MIALKFDYILVPLEIRERLKGENRKQVVNEHGTNKHSVLHIRKSAFTSWLVKQDEDIGRKRLVQFFLKKMIQLGIVHLILNIIIFLMEDICMTNRSGIHVKMQNAAQGEVEGRNCKCFET